MGPCPPSPKLTPNKFHENPSGAFRMQENLLAALKHSPDPLAGGEAAGYPFSKHSTPTFSPFGLGLWSFG